MKKVRFDLERSENMWNCLRKVSESTPDRIMYVTYSDRKALTASELAQRVKSFAYCLRDNGINEGDRCIIICDQNHDFITAFLACSYNGMIPVPLNDPGHSGNIGKWEKIAEQTKAACIITNSAYRLSEKFKGSEILSDIKMLCFSSYEASDKVYDEGYSETAFLQYTSGSTGTPKGVNVTNRSLMSNLSAMKNTFDLSSSSTIALWLPYYHDMGLVGGFLLSLYSGACLVYMRPVDFMISPLKWAKMISEYKATHTSGPNFAYGMLEQRLRNCISENNLSLGSLRCALCGSEPIDLITISEFICTAEKFGFDPAALKPGYGLAEHTLLAGSYPVAEPYRKAEWLCLSRKDLSENRIVVTAKGLLEDHRQSLISRKYDGVYLVGAGYSIPGHSITVRTNNGKTAAVPFVPGDIYVSGPSVASGYWADEQLTESMFSYEDGWFSFNTGDRGFFSDSGELYITGRTKEMLIINGKNYYPSDIEQIICSLDESFEKNGCAGFSFVSDDSEVLGAAVEITRKALKKPEFEKWAHEIRINVIMKCGLKIKKIIFLKPHHIQRTTSGKLQRTMLKKICETGDTGDVLYISDAPAPLFDFELCTEKDCTELIVRSLSEQTGLVYSVSDHDRTFNELGVTSVMCAVLSAKISSRSGIDFRPEFFYTYSDIRKAAGYIWGEIKNKTSDDEEDIIKQLKTELRI